MICKWLTIRIIICDSWCCYSDQAAAGGWSTKGLSVDKSHSNKTSVTCLTKHLTSFAVLVNIKGADKKSVRAD